MIIEIPLDEDHHVHSTFSDDAVSTLAQNVAAARQRGLRVLCLAEHVRRDSAWVPDYLSAVGALRPVPGLDVLAGVEAKILDRTGQLDLPETAAGADRVLIADHQFPGPDEAIGQLARQAAASGAVLEVNEKWACPSARTVRAFAAAGVELVASTDSHDCGDIGVYSAVRHLADGASPDPVP
jgi:histidinol phosphatase-like PHP family hydrolase